MADAAQLIANAIDRVKVGRVCADDGRSRVSDDVREFVRAQPVVDRHQHRPELRNRIKGLEPGVRVGRDVGHAIAGRNAEPAQRGRPPVAPLEELPVGEPQVAVHDRFAIRIERARPAGELEGSQGYFH